MRSSQAPLRGPSRSRLWHAEREQQGSASILRLKFDDLPLQLAGENRAVTGGTRAQSFTRVTVLTPQQHSHRLASLRQAKPGMKTQQRRRPTAPSRWPCVPDAPGAVGNTIKRLPTAQPIQPRAFPSTTTPSQSQPSQFLSRLKVKEIFSRYKSDSQDAFFTLSLFRSTSSQISIA